MENLVEGYNTSVMLYGVTGSGKTHTVFGNLGIQSSNETGIIYYATKDLFRHSQTTLYLSYIEIYNEKVKDLLAVNSNHNLMILQNSNGDVQVPGLSQIELGSFEDLVNHVILGNKKRKMAKTNSNNFSSRSHAIIQLTLRRKLGENVEEKIDEKYNAFFGIDNPNNNTESYVESKLSFIDLAGSERVCVSQAKGIRMTEGSNINKSLLALGNVINKLSDKRKGIYVPYRDSKLTRLLKDSLGGNTRTVLIACITPNSNQLDETIHSLNYAFRAKSIKTKIKRNHFKKGGKELTEFDIKNGEGSYDKSPYLQEIFMLRNEVMSLKKELEKERGGRTCIEKVYEELVLGIEEEFELKSSINELEQLQNSNISKLNELELKKEKFEEENESIKLKMLERDIRELEQIIDENEEMKMTMLNRIKIMENERKDWISQGVKNPNKLSYSKSPNIHKSSRGLSQGRRSLISTVKEHKNLVPLPLKNPNIRNNILSKSSKMPLKRKQLEYKKTDTPKKEEETYIYSIPDSCDKRSRRSLQSKHDLSSRLERQNSLLNEIDLSSERNSQRTNERKTEKKVFSKTSSIAKTTEGFGVIENENKTNYKKEDKIEDLMTKSNLRDELSKMNTFIQEQMKSSSKKKSIKYFLKKSEKKRNGDDLTYSEKNYSKIISYDENDTNSTRKILDFDDRKISKKSDSELLVFKDEFKSSNLYDISPPSEITSRRLNKFEKNGPKVEPIKLGVNDLTTSNYQKNILTEDFIIKKTPEMENILQRDPISERSLFKSNKNNNTFVFKMAQENENKEEEEEDEDSILKTNVNLTNTSCLNFNCSEINPPTETEQSSFFTAQLASTKLLCDIHSVDNSVNESKRNKFESIPKKKYNEPMAVEVVKTYDEHEIENFSSQKYPQNPEKMNDSMDMKLDDLQGLNPGKSEKKTTIQEKLTRARKRMRQFKKKLSLMKGFMDKYEKRAMKKGTMEIYKAVMILVEENRRHEYNLLNEEKAMLERMKNFGEAFEEKWGDME